MQTLSDIDVVILCGGVGTRLRKGVSDRPKVLAAVEDRAFLDILIEHLTTTGFSRFILCTGFRKEQVYGHIVQNHGAGLRSGAIRFSEETELLGTGGALKQAIP